MLKTSNLYSSQKSGGKPTHPLKNLSFVLEGKTIDKDALKTEIEKLGGKVSSRVRAATAAVVADKGKTRFRLLVYFTVPMVVHRRHHYNFDMICKFSICKLHTYYVLHSEYHIAAIHFYGF